MTSEEGKHKNPWGMSGKNASLRIHSPLRTTRASFPSSGRATLSQANETADWFDVCCG